MEKMIRKNPHFSLCGLNCCLCPRFNTDGTSRCPGCGGPGFSDTHPTCAVATCNRKHDAVEYCFQCGAYPCDRYLKENRRDSFVSYKMVPENMAEAKMDPDAYQKRLDRRYDLLRQLLAHYDDGKSKGLYCLVANEMPIDDLEELLAYAATLPKEGGAKEKAKQLINKILETANRLGVSYKLRK